MSPFEWQARQADLLRLLYYSLAGRMVTTTTETSSLGSPPSLLALTASTRASHALAAALPWFGFGFGLGLG